MKPIIGVVPLFDEEKNSYWMLPGYMKVIEKCGGAPIMLPLTSDEQELNTVYDLCHGILFTGGHDVNPALYGEEKSERCGQPCDLRDKMESYLLDRCLFDTKPIFGICRGIQFINVYMGGSLFQDLPSDLRSNVNHHMEPPYDRACHKVSVVNNTKLEEIIGSGVHDVNSYHHQAIKVLAPTLISSAISEDGLIEAVEVKNQKFAIAVQWHPEFSFETNEDSLKLIQAFIDACK